MDESPQLYYVTVPVSIGTFFGLIAGIILAWNQDNKQFWVVGTMFGGAFLGWLVSGWFMRRRQDWHYYQSVGYDAPTSQPAENTTTRRYLDLHIWTDKTHSSWICLGVTDEQWRTMAVSAHNAQAFSTDVIDRTIYGKLKKRFEENNIITSKGSGYELTRAGKNLVKMLATLPYPYEDEPELVKLLDENPRTQTRTDPYTQ